jgi:hypothetical protein
MINIPELLKKDWSASGKLARRVQYAKIATETSLEDLVELYKYTWEWGLITQKKVDELSNLSGWSIAFRPRCVYVSPSSTSQKERDTNYWMLANRFPGTYKSVVGSRVKAKDYWDGLASYLSYLNFNPYGSQYLTLITCANGIWPSLRLWGLLVGYRVVNVPGKGSYEDTMKVVMEIIEEGNPELFKMFDQGMFKKFVDDLIESKVK